MTANQRLADATRSHNHSPTVSVVIPTLNEELNLPHVFAALPPNLHQIVLVDGGSTDATVTVARHLRPDVHIINQTRTGKGNALACGFAACTGDIIVMIDADGSTDPTEIPRFVETLLTGADFAKGSRFTTGGHSHDITALRRLGNEGLNLLVNTLFGTTFRDLCYGYNAFWRHTLPVMDLPSTALPRPTDGTKLWGDGFEIETLINIRVAASGLTVTEVPSTEHQRIHGTSNLNTFRDGTRVLRTILSEYRRRTTRRRTTRANHHAAAQPVTPVSSPARSARPAGIAALLSATPHLRRATPAIPHLRRATPAIPRAQRVRTGRTVRGAHHHPQTTATEQIHDPAIAAPPAGNQTEGHA